MKIWLCWFQGEHDPSLSKRDKICIQRWREASGQHEVVILDQNKINTILPEYVDTINTCKQKRSFQHKADLLRLMLLEKYGGIWSDTSVYPIANVNEIVEETTQQTDVFFYSFSKKRISPSKGDRLIANWFMLAKYPNEYAIRALSAEYKKRFLEAKHWRYFEMHQAYCDLMENDTQFQTSLSEMKTLPAESALVLGRTTMAHLSQKQIDIHKQPTLMVKRPAPLSLAILPCINHKTPVRDIIKSIKEIESLQNNREQPSVPKEIADETLRCLNNIKNSKGAISPSLLSKSKSLHKKLISIYKPSLTPPNKIAYLHIGKCAGTTLHQYFKSNPKLEIETLHMNRIDLLQCTHYQFAFFIRHPASRFISAFNHTKRIVEFDTSHLDINNLNHKNCYAPKRIKRKMMHGGIAFSKEYDQLVRQFPSATALAEALYCKDKGLQKKAQRLMSLPNEHLFKGIGWYLHNGELVDKVPNNISFVGCVESIEEDLKRAKTIYSLKIESPSIQNKRARLSGSDTTLSTRGFENIRRWYSNTDYQAIETLFRHQLISKRVYESYQNIPGF